MAAIAFSEEDLHCPQCSDIYCLPVLLNCGHNICRVCLHKFWEWKGSQVCPVCHAVSVPARPPINLALKIAVDEYQLHNTSREQEVCRLHSERLRLFCHNDEEPICLVCQTSKQHRVHECCPVEEAAQQRKHYKLSAIYFHNNQEREDVSTVNICNTLQPTKKSKCKSRLNSTTEISATLESLKKKLKILNNTKEHWEDTKNYIQSQAYQTEVAIKEEFEKLHLFLKEEENTRLKVLKQEEEIKTQVMRQKLENIKDQIKTLSFTISEIETALKVKDLPFLQGYKQTKKRAKCNIGEPVCIRDILINTAKHVGKLRFGIWNKMADIIECAPITLDPNTAQANLKFSEELTCVQYSSKQPLPDNPERCTSRVCVLGSTGFTSGKHSWTVDVGHGKNWYIGVAQESIKRKSTVFLNPAEGFWVIGLCNGDSFWAQTSPRSKLTLKQKPEKITVQLDYDKGKVVFLNTADSTVIHTFKDKFTERIFPYFSPGLLDEGKNSIPLRICPLKIKVDVE